MTISLDQMAFDLAVDPQELQRRSLLAFVDKERRLAYLDIADLQDRYDVRSVHELSSRIEQHRIHAHPAWEDLIEWEQLEAYLNRLAAWQAELEPVHV